MRLISKLTLILCLAGAVSGCALLSPKRPVQKGPKERVFYAEYESVWRALQQALVKYPMRVSSIDAGIYETDYIKGEKAWVPPYRTDEYSAGFRYRLIVSVVKGRSGQRPAIKVSVNKLAEVQRDFFADPQPIDSDGLEEATILYRLQRELTLDRAIQRAQEKANQKMHEETGSEK